MNDIRADQKPCRYRLVCIRHAKPQLEQSERMDSSQFLNWIKRYDEAGIHIETVPNTGLIDALTQIQLMVHSPLPRAKQTADTLNHHIRMTTGSDLGPEQISDARYIEAPLPVYTLPRWLKFPASHWAVIYRLGWIMQIRKGHTCWYEIETLKETRQRAMDGVLHLEKLMNCLPVRHPHDPVIEAALVSHGLFLHELDKALLKKGWECIEMKNPRSCLGYRIYEKQVEESLGC
ncbi:hypothetical protein [Marinicrinis sediminis]|uniref:Phosphoglycerate mutase family protein n=1 Tax=Marinicrinis sediminis TaxID=1652465 RepID=A0ABW5R605_9BACL